MEICGIISSILSVIFGVYIFCSTDKGITTYTRLGFAFLLITMGLIFIFYFGTKYNKNK